MVLRYNRLIEDSINLHYHGKAILERILEEEPENAIALKQEKLNELDILNFYLANGYKLVQNEYAGYDGCNNSKEVPYLCLS